VGLRVPTPSSWGMAQRHLRGTSPPPGGVRVCVCGVHVCVCVCMCSVCSVCVCVVCICECVSVIRWVAYACFRG